MPSVVLLLSAIYLIPTLVSKDWSKQYIKKQTGNTYPQSTEEINTSASSSWDIYSSSTTVVPEAFAFDFRFLILIEYLIIAMSTRYWDEIDWYIQEGTQKLSQMLNDEKEDEDAASSKWSTGEDDHDHTEEEEEEEKGKQFDDSNDNKLIDKTDNMSIKDDVSDGDSDKVDEEEYMERSTSVEDENTTIIKKQQTKVDDLIALCKQFNMKPPIYTYFTAGEDQVVSTVQLWNGVRFSSHPRLNRDKAMEEAACQAIGFLSNEQKDKRPISTSPPSSLPYFLPVQGLMQPQYFNAAQTHFAPPVTFASAHPQAYFMPSVPRSQIPFPMIPPPMVTMPSEYHHAGMMPAYRFDPSYSPYIAPPTMIRVQMSPTRQGKVAPVYHQPTAAPHPVMWDNSMDSYHIQDTAAYRTKHVTTEYKLLDSPPSQNQKQISEQGPELSTPTRTGQSEDAAKTRKERNRKNTRSETLAKRSSSPQRTSMLKPKLAISFDKKSQSRK